MKIDSFSGKYRFLSNFYPCFVEYGGITYPSTEHAFQAAKTLDSAERLRISRMGSPGEAKRAGRRVRLRHDWEQVKVPIMLELLRKKFDVTSSRAIQDEIADGQSLGQKLLATGDAELIEGNAWGDRFWGVCNGVGENMLGKLLMQVREGCGMGSLETLAKLVANGGDVSIGFAESTKIVYVASSKIGWHGPVVEWQAALLAALSVKPSYTHLTDWVRSCPKGSCLLAVFANGENQPSIAQGDNDGKFLAFVTESELDEALSSRRHYNFVWMSKEVSLACRGKIPRGVEVYCER